MNITTELAKTFKFGQIENSCIEHYTAPSFEGLFYRIYNAIKSIFDWSDWQLAKKSLSEKAIPIVSKIIQPMPSTSVDRVAEFILRYLVTNKNKEAALIQPLVLEDVSATTSVDDFILRAAAGDGTTFPILSESKLKSLLMETRDAVVNLATDLQESLNHKSISKDKLKKLKIYKSINLPEPTKDDISEYCNTIVTKWEKLDKSPGNLSQQLTELRLRKRELEEAKAALGS